MQLKAKVSAAAQMIVNRAPKNEPSGVLVGLPDGGGQTIELRSPVADQIPGFSHTNALRDNIEMVGPKHSKLGKVLALCGAGPSLRPEVIDRYDDMWACNSALTYLLEHGITPTHAVAIDQTPQMLEEWEAAPEGPEYWIASTTDPALADHLLAHGRTVKWFHNACGFPDGLDAEFAHYDKDWPTPAFVLGIGATIVPRLIALAAWLGYRRIDIYGADCAFVDDDVVHANGGTAGEVYVAPVILEGTFRGKTWRTRPDLLMSAVDLARQVRQHPGNIRLIGDTLPVALMDLEDEELDTVVRRMEPGEIPTDGP